MNPKISSLFGLALALVSAGAYADTYVVDAKGYSVEVNVNQTIEQPDGTTIDAGGLSHATIENKTGEISSQWCRGSWASKGETFLGGGGFCTSVDADGEYLWIWFQPTGPGENRWGVIGGSGKWEGATGKGTSKTVSQSPDGRSWVATSTGKIKRR